MRKDIVLFVNAVRPATFGALREYEAQTGRHFTPVVLVDTGIREYIERCNGQHRLPEDVGVITADFDSAASIRQAIAPYANRVYAITSQYENCVMELKKLIPYFPYLPMPTESSLDWGTEKKLMRNLLDSHDRSLVPGYIEVADNSPATLKQIEATIQYPMIVKPSGLEGSLLVTRVNNRRELRNTIQHTFQAMQSVYDVWVKRQVPAVLVEEFMIGKKYVMDTYVAADGTCRHAPLITSKRGIEAGFDDFFEYQASLPPELDAAEIRAAEDAVERACHALGFRSVTADVELMRTASGWKIIELTARMGGYCHDMYSRSYGINHIVNDIRNRAGEAPDIPTALQNYVAVFDIYAHEEGILNDISGLEKVRHLKSFSDMVQHIQVGEPIGFAKHGGDSVFYLVFSHPNQAQLAADIATMEQVLQLHVKQATRDHQHDHRRGWPLQLKPSHTLHQLLRWQRN